MKEIKRKKEKKRVIIPDRSWVMLSLLLVVLVAALVGAGAGFLAGKVDLEDFRELTDNFKSPNGKEIEKNEEPLTLAEEEKAVVAVVEKASPAVVSIVVTKDVSLGGRFFEIPFFDDPFFNPFGRQNQGETEKREVGGGTGFIINSDGYIITNRHVVEEENAEYTVVMSDGEKVEAKVLGRDQFVDIAVLKIEEENLPIVQLGDSEKLKIGQTVIAIGNSLGEFRNTVSKGIISGLKRNITAGDGLGRVDTLDEVIQTDAAINHGNSGGPILNLQGQAVGVNVAMAQGAENIGFAIPINEVKSIYQSIKETGKIVRPYLGVRYVMNNPQIAKENNLDYDYGAIIVRGERRTDLAVIPGSPADKAGLQENDVILEIDGQRINEENDLGHKIIKKRVGEVVELKVWSKGKTKKIKVELEGNE